MNYGFKDIVIRTASEPRLLLPEIRRQLHELDPDMPFAEVQTMDEIVEAQTGGQRFTTVLLASFAAAGLALAIVGIYGVVSFLVVQRKQELAVRLALGAGSAGGPLACAAARFGNGRVWCGPWTPWRLGHSEIDQRPSLRHFAG